MDAILKSIQEESLGLLLLKEQPPLSNDESMANLKASCNETLFIGQLMSTKRKHVIDCYDLQFKVELLLSRTVRMSRTSHIVYKMCKLANVFFSAILSTGSC